jgi:acyl-CoA thioester hydrolase
MGPVIRRDADPARVRCAGQRHLARKSKPDVQAKLGDRSLDPAEPHRYEAIFRGETVTTRDLFRCSVSIPIRYADIDAQRHLNNVAYFAFMEHARVVYLHEVGLWREGDFDAIGMIVAEAVCTYAAPAYLGETVTVWTRVSHLGTKSFHVEYLLETEQGEIATGQSVQVCYDYAAQRSMPIPDEWRKAIASYEPGL